MADSISEGTLKQWLKSKIFCFIPFLISCELSRWLVASNWLLSAVPKLTLWNLTSPEVGQFVKQDEEVATIETDKVIYF